MEVRPTTELLLKNLFMRDTPPAANRRPQRQMKKIPRYEELDTDDDDVIEVRKPKQPQQPTYSSDEAPPCEGFRCASYMLCFF